MPTLEEVLTRYVDRAHLRIELKSDEPELAKTVASLLSSHGWLKGNGELHGVPSVSIISFDLDQLRRSKEVLADLAHGYLFIEPEPTAVDVCAANGFECAFPNIQALNVDLTEAARTAGLLVRVCGASKPGDILKASNLGVVGVTADSPDAVRMILDSAG